MLELNGKFNSCKIFTDNIDSETISQIYTVLNQESVVGSKIRIMPDCHAGAGCVIGTTMTITDKIIPNLVGVDIGCGMLAVKLDQSYIDFEELDKVIHQYVPSGYSIHDHAITTSDIKDIIAPIDIERSLKSLGTLGGGNHFIEIDKDQSDNSLWLIIHTGSRHLGLEVCKHYQDLAWKTIKDTEIRFKIDKTIAKLKSEGKTRDIENTIKILKMQSTLIPKDLCYVQGKDFENYIHDMKITQDYASINRATIADQIIYHMGWSVADEFETVHNYIDTTNMILRKGAVSALKGEPLLIPINMRDGSLICIGKGNDDWNQSAPHGAGRVLSRAKAKELISMKEYKSSMKGIYTTSVNESTLDESPMAYKPIDDILDNIKDTVDVENCLKPVYNFKAS